MQIKLSVKNNQIINNSVNLAKVLEIRHADLLETIRNILSKTEEKFRNGNFRSETYTVRGREYACYDLLKDGIVYLLAKINTEKANKFTIAYINEFNHMQEQLNEKINWHDTRSIAKLGYRTMCQALDEQYQLTYGKRPEVYEYINNANMLDRMVLGMTSKQYCIKYNIDQKQLRDRLTQLELAMFDKLQMHNTSAIELGIEFKERQELLAVFYNNQLKKLASNYIKEKYE